MDSNDGGEESFIGKVEVCCSDRVRKHKGDQTSRTRAWIQERRELDWWFVKRGESGDFRDLVGACRLKIAERKILIFDNVKDVKYGGEDI